MSVVTEHLTQQGNRFEVLAHRQASTCVDEARALGMPSASGFDGMLYSVA